MRGKHTQVALVCERCGQPFTRRRSRVGRFCSRRCARHDPERIEDRFWKRVVIDGDCWLWQGGKNEKGYGQVRWMGRNQQAHRLAYILAHGPIPAGMVVCHRCDRPGCINPAHLFLGTPAINSYDMVSKGRAARGERAPQATITEPTAREILIRSQRGESIGTLAKAYGVGRSTVQHIRAGRTWKHLRGQLYLPLPGGPKPVSHETSVSASNGTVPTPS